MITLRGVLTGLKSLVVGLGVTGRHMVRPVVTLQYPHQRPDASHWGGPIELVCFPETGTHDCIACNACARICPSDCFDITGVRPAAVRSFRATITAPIIATTSSTEISSKAST